jgi:hypothetical protein
VEIGILKISRVIAAKTMADPDFWLGFLTWILEGKDYFFSFKKELEERNWEWVRARVWFL